MEAKLASLPFLSLSASLGCYVCTFRQGEHEQRALWVLEMTQLPSPKTPGHVHRAKSVVLG